jgi:hypothetical protein
VDVFALLAFSKLIDVSNYVGLLGDDEDVGAEVEYLLRDVTLMPLTKVTTAITADTPITTPSKVSTDRSLFAHNDCKAMRIASRVFMFSL